MNRIKATNMFTGIWKVMNEEYKDFKKTFALRHYAERQLVVYNYTHSHISAMNIYNAALLLSIFTDAPNVHAGKITDWKIIPPKQFITSNSLILN